MILELRGWYWVVGLRSTVSAVKRWKMMRLLLGVSFFGNKIGLLLVVFLPFFLFFLSFSFEVSGKGFRNGDCLFFSDSVDAWK